MHLNGVGLLPEYKRFYPNGSLAANLIGAVGYDAEALSGLELTHDKTLKSNDPPLLVEQDAKGRSYEPYALVGLEHPNQISLTIDKTIQYIAERELKTMVEKTKARGGVSIVMEADTGAVLSLAVYPTFDPNDYSKHDFKNWRNRAVTDSFEPGSIFKAITAATALETGVVNTTEKIHCGNGTLKVGKDVIHDHHPYGPLNIAEIIKYSSNICSYKLAHRVGKNRFHQFIRDFGFGAKTGIEAPGEISGLLASAERMSSIQLGTVGFGQGISVTPLQIATAYGAIANGGFLMKPYLIKEIRDSKGTVIQSYGPKIVHRVLGEATAKQTTELLKTVVEEGGTGTQARLEGYSVAGKTGTAQKVVEGKKGYAEGKYIASFVGFAPAENPRLVVLVSIDEPVGSHYGGVVSAPAFQKIMEQSLAYLKVPPTKGFPENTEKKTAKKIDSAPTQKKSEAAPKPIVKADDKGEVEKELDPLKNFIPDFKGLSVREALRKAQASNFKIKILGSGICLEQAPPAGEMAEAGTAVVVECRPPG
jgi:cell division protein FtsI (penicillin-binding protein 3)